MSFLTEWITNIIILILLATILELMLPSSTMKRYVKMVVGILLLVVMLQPLLSFLTEDIDTWLFSVSKEANRTEQSVASSINLQKREIELGQRAYISEQVAVQLKSQVAEEIREKHELTIVRINVEISDETMLADSEQQVQAISVYVEPVEAESTELESSKESHIQKVEVVHIDTSLPTFSEGIQTDSGLEPARQFLSMSWNIPKEKISLVWEGGYERNES